MVFPLSSVILLFLLHGNKKAGKRRWEHRKKVSIDCYGFCLLRHTKQPSAREHNYYCARCLFIIQHARVLIWFKSWTSRYVRVLHMDNGFQVILISCFIVLLTSACIIKQTLETLIEHSHINRTLTHTFTHIEHCVNIVWTSCEHSFTHIHTFTLIEH